MKTIHLLIALIATALVLGCGGAQKSNTEKLLEGEDENVDLYAHLTGIDDETEVDEEEEEEEMPEAMPSSDPGQPRDDEIGGSQGAFVGRLVIAGEELSGTFRVKTLDGDTVLENQQAGQEVLLDPGTYDFIFTTPEVVGDPEFTLREVTITAGRRTKRDIKFPVGKITLVTGARCSKRPIKIKPKGATDWYPGKYYTCKQLTLRAGTYEAEVGGGKRGTPITGIQVYDGGIRDILIRPK